MATGPTGREDAQRVEMDAETGGAGAGAARTPGRSRPGKTDFPIRGHPLRGNSPANIDRFQAFICFKKYFL